MNKIHKLTNAPLTALKQKIDNIFCFDSFSCGLEHGFYTIKVQGFTFGEPVTPSGHESKGWYGSKPCNLVGVITNQKGVAQSVESVQCTDKNTLLNLSKDVELTFEVHENKEGKERLKWGVKAPEGVEVKEDEEVEEEDFDF